MVIRAVRKSANVRQDDLAGIAKVSRQFAIDAERGKPTMQLGKVLQLLEELGIALSVDVPDDVAPMLEQVKEKRATSAWIKYAEAQAGQAKSPGAKRSATDGKAEADEDGDDR
ncbi:helix-turn-helix transcriptional regulator [Roseateles aquatilis]|uniref:helix-turn-helix transcriptional regulator n=1 Tax=Roseateles aquatilis TaxID=431061 RepID=UPI00192D1A97|nr:helix-turn-helix transcriptional regulator [Roseateles aquatilis]